MSLRHMQKYLNIFTGKETEAAMALIHIYRECAYCVYVKDLVTVTQAINLAFLRNYFGAFLPLLDRTVEKAGEWCRHGAKAPG